ncbi:MAG: hypothetical protein AB7S48_15115 [Bacteroidales bacterium]
MIKSIIKSILVFVGFGLLAVDVIGQDFEVAPVRLEFDAEPATSQTKVINIRNHSNKKVSYTIAIADFIPSSDGLKKTLPPNSTKRSCANWLNINPLFFELNPNDDIQVQVTMLVPGSEYGTSWCMLYIQPAREQTSWNADKSIGAGISVTGRIGVQVYQSPKSNTSQSIKINNLLEITQPQDTARKFSATVENLGDRVTNCKVFLMASNMSNADEVQFPEFECEVFPKLSRNVELVLPNTLPTGTYALAAIVDYGPKFPLEGAQIIIEVKGGSSRAVKPDTTSVNH